jgi:Tfp pilus assembly PilM family ATPase
MALLIRLVSPVKLEWIGVFTFFAISYMKLALDWDDEQIRMVVAEPSGRGLHVRAAAVVSIGESGLQATLAELTQKYSLEKSEVLVAVGRDRAELRQMEFPPVPSEELPDMVRFQAIRQFASAGENAAIDFITTHSDDQGIKAIVAATGPVHLAPIRKTCEAAGWTLSRVALRPIASAALYRLKASNRLKLPTAGQTDSSDESEPTVALIDLVADEAEIVLLRDSEIVFVRSVRLPAGESGGQSNAIARTGSLAGEIRRSMIACGATGPECHVVMWGTADRHGDELRLLSERLSQQQATPCQTLLIDPLELVGVDTSETSIQQSTGSMIGRLAPLIGLLVADADDAGELIDFLNPRQTIEVTTDRRKVAAMIGIPVALAATIIWLLWGNLARLDTQIEQQTAANNELRTKTKSSDVMIERTEKIDQFLDSDVNWLDEFEQLASSMPAADQLIVKEISAVANSRDGGGRIVVSGLVTSPEVIDAFEAAMRNDSHQVIGDKVTQLPTADAYRWQMIETIALAPAAVREKRYSRIEAWQNQNTPVAEINTDAEVSK